MLVSDFDFSLPEELIARQPSQPRGESRLMVIDPSSGEIAHRRFSDIVEYFNPGDILLLNNTRVLPCRIQGTKQNGHPLDILLVKDISDDGSARRWEVRSRGGYTGTVEVSNRLTMQLHNGRIAELSFEGQLRDVLEAVGEMPLPPYLKRRAHEGDRTWYQTVFARHEGSIAAPTAGLHYTEALLDALRAKGVHVRFLTLHVGVGTFLPIRVERTEEHEMQSEFFSIENNLLQEIRERTGKLITVGTTTTRAIEGYFSGRFQPVEDSSLVHEGSVCGVTDIFITPGYEFRVVDALQTNFHLPGSTPQMLSAALAGREFLLQAYESAVIEKYGFFSYGDAMLIIRER